MLSKICQTLRDALSFTNPKSWRRKVGLGNTKAWRRKDGPGPSFHFNLYYTWAASGSNTAAVRCSVDWLSSSAVSAGVRPPPIRAGTTSASPTSRGTAADLLIDALDRRAM